MAAARAIAEWVKKHNEEEQSSVERLTALIAIRLNNYGVILLVLIIGAISGKIIPTIIAVICFVLLRINTGGFHLKSLDACFIVSTLLLAGIPHVPLTAPMIIAANAVSVALVLLYSERRRRLPVIAILLNCFFLVPAAAMAFLLQAITLIKIRR